MKPVVITKFGGIAPRYAPYLKPGMAQTAEDCDISSGKIYPMQGHVAAGAGSGNSLHYYGGEWLSGTDKYYVEWPIDAYDILLYLEGGVPMKRVGDSVAGLGQDLPSAPSVEVLSSVYDFTLDEDARVVLVQSSVATEFRPAILYNGRLYDVRIDVLPSPYGMEINGSSATPGALGSLGALEWATGDQDSLGYDTFYIGISGLVSETVGETTIADLGDNGITGIVFQATQLGSLVTGWTYDGTAPVVGLEFYTSVKYRIACLCGGGHGRMVVPDVSFDGVFVNDNAYSEVDSYGALEEDAWFFAPPDDTPDGLFVGTGSALSYTSYSSAGVLDLIVFCDLASNGMASFIATVGTGDLTDTVTYAITTTRNVGGHEDESGLGGVSDEVTAQHGSVRVTRPAIADEDVVSWTIYRLGDATGQWQKVDTVDISETVYDDTLGSDSLGDSPTTFYTSDQGNEILFSKPGVAFDGLAGVGNGMVYGWAGQVLYWCEPGQPDAWPPYYTMNFSASIRGVYPLGGVLAVMTEIGAFRVDGSHPELLQPSDPLGLEPVLGSAPRRPRGSVT